MALPLTLPSSFRRSDIEYTLELSLGVVTSHVTSAEGAVTSLV